MAIDSIDKIVDGFGQKAQQLVFNKQPGVTATAGFWNSFWLRPGHPGLALTPTTAAVCNKEFQGAFKFDNPTGGNKLYLARLYAIPSIASQRVCLVDRLAHAGGYSGIVTTLVNVNIDISGSGDNLPARINAADYSSVQWWVETYINTGSTSRTLTVNYTNHLNNTAVTSVVFPVSMPIARLTPIKPLEGHYIKSIQSVQLDASTGTAGNYGITATHDIYTFALGAVGAGEIYGWQRTGLPEIANDACLHFIQQAGTTGAMALYGAIKLIEG